MRSTTCNFPVTTLIESSLNKIRSLIDHHDMDPGFRLNLALTNDLAGFREPENPSWFNSHGKKNIKT